jgi:CBS domain-containing protein
MNVESVMTPAPKTCTTADTANQAALLMWENDLGSLPVVDASGRLRGMVTDRDLCMAGYTQGKSMHEIGVESVMSTAPITLVPLDSIADAITVFTESQVRRLPVVDIAGSLVGILSISDLVNAHVWGRLPKDFRSESILNAMHAINKPRKAPSRAETQGAESRNETKEVFVPKPAPRAQARA